MNNAVCFYRSAASAFIDWLTAMSKTRLNYILSYVFEISWAIAFTIVSCIAQGSGRGAVLSFLTGFFTFSFVEYGIHRWWFHSPASFMTPSHLAHHANPRQPAALPCICSIVILPFVWWGFAAAFGLKNGSAALGGFLTGYVLYSVVHHMQHSVRVSRLPFKWMRRWWVSHAIHHGRRDANFGVTTPLWDYVLGTHTTHGRTRTSHDVTMRTDRADGIAS